jgi:acetoin utilization protein AcuB
MLVRHRMTRDPITVGPQDTLATAQAKMTAGHFRRVPVVQHGVLVGILTDLRDKGYTVLSIHSAEDR